MGDGPEITSPSDKETKLDNLKPLIRVIDDDYAMRRSWAFLIEGEGWEVVTYSNALAFLAANDFSRPGCLLLDVRMPRRTRALISPSSLFQDTATLIWRSAA